VKFETPAALWGLASIALLVLFSLWRQGAQRVTVPSLLLWKKIRERNPPVRALRRPRWRIEMLLQALAIAAAVSALAGPYRETDEPKPRRIAMVFDTSARMRAGDRLSQAKVEALKLVSAKLTGDDVKYYAASPSPRRLASSDGAIQVDTRVDLEPLLAAARQGADQVVLYTDRPVEGARLALLGAPMDNVGIVEFTVSDEEVFIRLVNHGPPRPLPVEMIVGETKIRDTLAPGQRTWFRRGDYSKAVSVKVALDARDSFPLDDRVEATRLNAPSATVTLTGRQSDALVRAFRSIPGVTVLRGDPAAQVSVGWDDVPGQADLRVWIHSSPGRVPGEVLVSKHPLTADLEKRGGELASADLGELPAAERSGTPLLTVGGKVAASIRGRDVHLSIDLNKWRQSLPSFPIFCTNLVDFARKGTPGFAILRSGVASALPPGSSVEQAPEGALWSLSAEGVFLGHTVGDYGLKTPEGLKSVRVNLLDERESDTAGQTRGLDWDPGITVGRVTLPRDFTGWAAGAALLFLLLAWLLQLRPE
jgi:hypothetical protein